MVPAMTRSKAGEAAPEEAPSLPRRLLRNCQSELFRQGSCELRHFKGDFVRSGLQQNLNDLDESPHNQLCGRSFI